MKTIQVSEETYDAIKDQLLPAERMDLSSLDDLIGKSFYFRTVTYHLTGKVTGVIGNLLTLEDSAWIADSGRFMQAIKDGKLNEVEPTGDAIVNLDAVTDFYPWPHDLPTAQK